jgi:sugar-specific transcriptional regulator TrmB
MAAAQETCVVPDSPRILLRLSRAGMYAPPAKKTSSAHSGSVTLVRKMDLERHARQLQDIGLNAYESRAYLVLIGHLNFKALEVAGRANIPRQKIYEVLDSLIEKGFVQVVQGKAKLFSAVEPKMALQGYLARRKEAFERQFQERQKLAEYLRTDLAAVFADGNQGRGPLDYLRIVADNAQIAEQYRRLLAQSEREYVEFAKPPFAVDPVGEPIVEQLAAKGVECRLLFDKRVLETKDEREKIERLAKAGAEVRLSDSLPMKLALFDQRRGMISLDDPVVSHPQITALVFDHESLASAMGSLFSDFWSRGKAVDA